MRQLAILPILAWVLAACCASNLPADDIDIARQLSNRLRVAKAEGDLKGFRINVKVEDSVVWLTGKVPNISQQQLALQHAQEIPGVRLVVNKITVGDEAPLADVGISELDENSSLASIVNGNPTDEALITAPKLPATRTSSSLVDRAVASIPQNNAPAAVNAAGLSYTSVPSAIPASHSAATPSYMLVPNVGYVGLAPANGGAIPTQLASSVVPVVPAIVPVPTAQATSPYGSAPRPVPIAAPARLVNYQGDYYGGSPGGVPVSECGPGSGYCAGGQGCPGCSAGGPPFGPGDQFGGGPFAGSQYGSGFGTGYGTGAQYENPQMPAWAWPSYASYPNYAAVTYPRQYSPTAWPYIGPFYPYPQVPLGWRKVCLEWDDGWWMLDFKSKSK